MFDYAWWEEVEVVQKSRWVFPAISHLLSVNRYKDESNTNIYLQHYRVHLCLTEGTRKARIARSEKNLGRAFFFSMIRTRNASQGPVIDGPRP